jgi:hypothetical protein
MSGFEEAWVEKLSSALVRYTGEDARREVFDSADPTCGIIGLVEMISQLLGRETAEEVFTACACHYPHDDLGDVRRHYRETGDVDEVLMMLRDKFTAFLRDVIGAREEIISELLTLGWGLAGVRSGNTIIATKIPKSGNLIRYMNETDPGQRRNLYCHCPLVRDAVTREVSISPVYCYCGAGFYRDLWEEILGEPPEVEVVSSIFMGDDVCSFALRLPASCQACWL